MEEDLNIIRKVVWSYVRSNPGLEFEELFAEACLAYVEALPAYNPERGRKSTFIWVVVRNHLNSILGKTNKCKEFPVDWTDMEYTISTNQKRPEDIIVAREEWCELVASLSPEARAVCSLVTEGDYSTNKPRNSRGKIARELRQQGWPHSRVWKTFKELKGVLN